MRQKTDFSKLESELREKLPPDQIIVNVETRLASYYDYHGVTFREDDAEQQLADDYVVRAIAEKAGFPIRITKWGPSNNGHFAHYFEKIPEE